MSEESSGPTSPRDLGLDQVCVVICNGDDPEGCSGDAGPNPVVVHSEGAVQKEKDDAEVQQEQQDCQAQAMLAEEESRVDGKSDTRKDSTKQQQDRPQQQQQQQHNATFGVTAEEEEDELPFPGFVPKTFYYFNQRHWLRFPCLRLITSPYPLGQGKCRTNISLGIENAFFD